MSEQNQFFNQKPENIFKILFILAFTVLFTAGCEEFIDSGYRYQDSFTRTISLKEAGSFSLTNINGSITVTTSPSLEVSIKAIKYARWRKSDLDKIRIEVVSGEKSVIVDTVHGRRNLRVKVDYEINLPEGMALETVKTVNGRINISGKFERALLRTTNGGITARGDFGWLEATTTNGSLDIAQAKGRINLKTTNGSIRLVLDELAGDLSARTTNGSITIKLANQPDGYFTARTTNGSIRVDYPVTIEGSVSRRRIEGRMGSGQGPRIDLQTTNGSINLLKY